MIKCWSEFSLFEQSLSRESCIYIGALIWVQYVCLALHILEGWYGNVVSSNGIEGVSKRLGFRGLFLLPSADESNVFFDNHYCIVLLHKHYWMKDKTVQGEQINRKSFIEMYWEKKDVSANLSRMFNSFLYYLFYIKSYPMTSSPCYRMCLTNDGE